MNALSISQPVLALLLAPFLLGVINRVKAVFAGRTGQPLLQAYHDLLRLLRKGAVYSRTTTWIFRAGPVIGLASVLVALSVVPFGNIPAPIHFGGDLLLLAYGLGLMRFFTVVAALDTGSAFEGMGASREVQFSALAEPSLLLGLAAISCKTASYSLSTMLPGVSSRTWATEGPGLAMIAVSMMVILLAENARIPVDDPNTHLELTMIHEVMVLDHSGPDFAFILYSAALKLWVMGALLIGFVLPVRTGNPMIDLPAAIAGMIILAALIGVIESVMARLRLLHVPQLLVWAGVIAVIGLILVLR
ncbi:MAG: respiratory-chain dehydrogenase subunit 1 [Acidobacteria bacterium]|nr:respiratory-chain dehydrogenase subunit 1 [Acidobacteriota bacterium]